MCDRTATGSASRHRRGVLLLPATSVAGHVEGAVDVPGVPSVPAVSLSSTTFITLQISTDKRVRTHRTSRTEPRPASSLLLLGQLRPLSPRKLGTFRSRQCLLEYRNMTDVRLYIPIAVVITGMLTFSSVNTVRRSNFYNRPSRDDSYLTVPAKARLSSIAVSPDGRLVATAGNDSTVRLELGNWPGDARSSRPCQSQYSGRRVQPRRTVGRFGQPRSNGANVERDGWRSAHRG